MRVLTHGPLRGGKGLLRGERHDVTKEGVSGARDVTKERRERG